MHLPVRMVYICLCDLYIRSDSAIGSSLPGISSQQVLPIAIRKDLTCSASLGTHTFNPDVIAEPQVGIATTHGILISLPNGPLPVQNLQFLEPMIFGKCDRPR